MEPITLNLSDTLAIAGIFLAAGIALGQKGFPKALFKRRTPDEALYQEFKQRDYVQRFEEYLKCIENKDHNSGWQLLSRKWTDKYKDVDGLKRDYAFTQKYQIHNYIPIEERDDMAKFYVFFTFTDLVPEMTNLLAARNGNIQNMKYITGDAVIYEIIYVLRNFFDCSHMPESSVYNQVKEYMSYLPIRHFIYGDWRFIVNIAHKMNLHLKNSSSYTKPLIPHSIRTFSEVTMEKINKTWMLSDFSTISIERWGGGIN